MIFTLSFGSEDEKSKFEYIYNRYKPLLMLRALKVLGDRMLAEDAVSEAFLRIYRNLGKVDNPDSPKSAAFFVTIVRNTSLTLLKSRRNETVSFEEFEPQALDSPEREALMNASVEAIGAVLNRLGGEMKDAFMLKYSNDLPHREIAKILGTSENNVTVMLHRARKKLAEMLREEGVTCE